MDEVGEHQRHDHQQVRDALVNRRPCSETQIIRRPLFVFERSRSDPDGAGWGYVDGKNWKAKRTHRRWWAPGRGPARRRRRPARRWRRRRRRRAPWRRRDYPWPWHQQQVVEHRQTRDEESRSALLVPHVHSLHPPYKTDRERNYSAATALSLSLLLSLEPLDLAGTAMACCAGGGSTHMHSRCGGLFAVCGRIGQSGIEAGPGWLRCLCLCRHLNLAGRTNVPPADHRRAFCLLLHSRLFILSV